MLHKGSFASRLGRLAVLVMVVAVLVAGIGPALAQSSATDFTFTGWSLNEGATRRCDHAGGG